ncbi:hypothetical protein Scel_84960 [Streptomyces cellostaticus]|nr:hypothetical protein Scel_84960 [Streptomyces cellostaticus]
MGGSRGTWQVEYTAGSIGHAPGATLTTRIGTVDEYGPDKATGKGPYGLGDTATTGDVNRKADATGAWSTHEVVNSGPRPSGSPRSHTRTTTVTLHVADRAGSATAEDKCTLTVG